MVSQRINVTRAFVVFIGIWGLPSNARKPISNPLGKRGKA